MKIKADSIIFDLDGVLVDVSQSYRLAIKKTVNYFLAKNGIPIKATQGDINMLKALPGFNNDWDTTTMLLRLILNKIPREFWKEGTRKWSPIDRRTPLFRRVFNIFQALYLGTDLYSQIYQRKAPLSQRKGLINSEPLIVKKQILRKLKSMGYKLAISTGRPRFEAVYVLRKNGLLPQFFSENSVVALEDVKREKPDPEPLLEAQKRLKAKNPVYIGDTINDILAAKGARMKSIFIGNEEPGDYQVESVNQIINLLKGNTNDEN